MGFLEHKPVRAIPAGGMAPAHFSKGRKMYGSPTMGYGVDVVRSSNALNDALEHRQALHPKNRFALRVAGRENKVKLLPNGLVEWDGEVPSIAVEKRLDDILKKFGGILFERR
jgi:hypothetical protein